MSVLTQIFAEARAILDLPAAADKAAIKRAYRRKTIEHPPDQDPEGFRRIRESYELLSNPLAGARTRLLHQMPHAPPPSIPEARPPDEPLVVALLRQIVGGLTAEQVEGHLSAITPGKSGSA